VHAYTMAIAHFNSSLNPVLYAVAWVKYLIVWFYNFLLTFLHYV
jgi:hypothetical protein